jgi:alpha-D-xyloside xylohydrolase
MKIIGSILKCSLMPHLYKIAKDASINGIPFMRSMMLEFQNDPSCSYLDKQYMIGSSILVAPIFNEEGEANYYLPEGIWTNFISGKRYEGGRWIKEKHDYLSVPIMVKENSLIAVGNENSKPDYNYRKNVSILAYELKENEKTSTSIIDMKGNKVLEIEVLKTGNNIVIESTGSEGNWSLVFKKLSNVETVDGGEPVIEGEDIRVEFTDRNCQCICKLKN